MSLGVQNVKGGLNNKPKSQYFGVNWNQMSDEACRACKPHTFLGQEQVIGPVVLEQQVH